MVLLVKDYSLLCQNVVVVNLFISHFQFNTVEPVVLLHCVKASPGNDSPDDFGVKESENPQVLTTSEDIIPDQKI